ncbi:DUF6188 family protein [Streptomyces sp. NPDC088785]|uniref:DUF6188 family protein n=1 Tax=Streptomyces sp. NPDC088785 TaxID=3365897 RepID=UPI0037FCE183
MTERKPPGVSFESFVDRQIRAAERRGDFTALSGAGKPFAPDDDTTSYDENWWIKRKMAREGLSVLPPSLALRKEVEDAFAAFPMTPSEHTVRRVLTELNDKIRDMMFKPPPGPPLGLKPYDVDEVVRRWRLDRAGRRLPVAGLAVRQVRVDDHLTLVLETGARIVVTGPAALGTAPLDPATQRVAPALALVGAEPVAAVVHPGGRLVVEFTDGSRLTAAEGWSVTDGQGAPLT